MERQFVEGIPRSPGNAKEQSPPATSQPLVGIVVLNYQNADDTLRCVQSLGRLDYPSYEVIVVDNASAPECVRELNASVAAAGSVQLIENDRNLGYAAGNNVGIRAALQRGAEYVLIINPDSVVTPDFLSALVAAVEPDPLVAIACPRLQGEDGTDETRVRSRPRYADYFRHFGLLAYLRSPQRAGQSELRERDAPIAVEVPSSGACMLIRRDFLEQIGLLDERTFLYQEEVILAEQMRSLGRRCLLVPRAVVTHVGARSTRKIGVRWAFALWRSQDYYLREYRGVGPVRRGLLIGYQAASLFLLEGLSLSRRRLRSAWHGRR